MRTQTLISLAALFAAAPGWGAPPTTDEAIIGEVLQHEITVEPERIAHHLLRPPTWPATERDRPQPVAATFPGVPGPPATTGETGVTGNLRE